MDSSIDPMLADYADRLRDLAEQVVRAEGNRQRQLKLAEQMTREIQLARGMIDPSRRKKNPPL